MQNIPFHSYSFANKADSSTSLDKVTIAILAQNSEKTIERTLKSLRSQDKELRFNNILIIDGGSTDKTESICNNFSTTFIQNKFQGFSKQRNFALNNISTEWTLFIDSDESMTEDLAQEITKTLQKANFDIYNIFRTEYLLGEKIEHGFGRSGYQTRLMKSDLFEYAGTVHETPSKKDQAQFLIGNLSSSARLLHDTNRDLKEVLKRTFDYSYLTFVKKNNKKRNSSLFHIWLIFNYNFLRLIIQNRKLGFRGALLAISEVLHKTIVYLYIYEKKHRTHERDLVS